MNRKPIFDAVRTMLGRAFKPAEVSSLDAAIDTAMGIETKGRAVSPSGIALMHRWEGLVLKAYPDPGSKDGKPWTIGRGSTGPDIGPGTVWTQAQADARFEQDLQKFAAGVSAAVGTATQGQFDAMVSLAYNIGLRAFTTSTLLKKHLAGDYAGAATEFGRWNRNDGKVMKGLTNRRADEAKLYRGAS